MSIFFFCLFWRPRITYCLSVCFIFFQITKKLQQRRNLARANSNESNWKHWRIVRKDEQTALRGEQKKTEKNQPDSERTTVRLPSSNL